VTVEVEAKWSALDVQMIIIVRLNFCSNLTYTFWSRPALGPTQPPIQWVPEALSLVVKRPAREADH